MDYRTVDAASMTPDQIKRFFQPNKVAEEGSRHVLQVPIECSYDRLAQPDGAYYLVAERGVGKTHLLRLLENQLTERGDLVLSISVEADRITNTYIQYKRKFGAELSRCWQLAILEEVALALSHISIPPSSDPSNIIQKMASLVRGEIRFNSLFYNYIEQYRPNKLKALENTFKDIRHIQYIFFRKLFGSKDKDSSPGDEIAQGENIEIIQERIVTVGEWVWAFIRELQKVYHPDVETIEHQIPIRRLPKTRSVYVIADKLDQSEQPFPLDDLVSLIDAAKILNEIAAEQLGKKLNFKVVVSLRAATFWKMVEENYIKDWEQLRGKVEELNWSKPAIIRLLASRILDWRTHPAITKTSLDILHEFLPNVIHYLGREFSIIDFFLEFAEHRPRQILYLWQASIPESRIQDPNIYRTPLEEDHVMMGLKEFSRHWLGKDVADEHSSEYPRLLELLNFLNGNRQQIDTCIPYDRLENLVSKMPMLRKSIDDLPNWCKTASAAIDSLFKIGFVGIPKKRLEGEIWQLATYVDEERNFFPSHHPHSYIKPSYWHYLTNIENVTQEYRKIYVRTYRYLRDIIEKLDDPQHSEKVFYEYQLGCYLAVCRESLYLTDYPEPLDWRFWQKIRGAIEESWHLLATSEIFDISDSLDHTVLFEEIALDFIQSTDHSYIREFELPSIEQFKRSIYKKENYSRKIEPVRLWLNSFDEQVPLSEDVLNFLSIFNIGENSMVTLLSDAIDELS